MMGQQNHTESSIIIATYNRAKYLSLCLEALAVQDTDIRTFEVIVIDNNSTDNTRETVLSFAASHPAMCVHYLSETRQGASIARNRGIRHGRGEIFCFLDDDVVVTPPWLNAMSTAFADPTVGCVGGPAILDFQGRDVPSWLHGDLKGLLSGYGLGYSEPTVITAVGEYPFLCNMAVRRKVLDQVGLFRSDLGPVGNNLGGGEETELVGRIRQAGWRVLYFPDAKTWHLVAPERLEKQYIYRTGLRLAVTHVCITWDRRVHIILRWFASDAWYATRMLLRLTVALAWRRPLWFDDYMRFWMVAMRIPLRIRALLHGKNSILAPKITPAGQQSRKS